MSIEGVLAKGRAAAERRMRSSCLVQRLASEYTDEATGVITPAYATIYAGKCRIQQSAAQASAEDAGEARRLMVPREVHLPIDSSGGIKADDLVTITASASDPDLVGRRFVLREEMAKDDATARRMGIREETS